MDWDDERRDIPLAVKYETSAIWADIQRLTGAKPTGAVVAVAAYEARSRDKWVSYARARNYYDRRVNHRLLSYRRVLGSVDKMEAGEWIENYVQPVGRRGRQSTLRATPKLVDAMGRLLADRPHLPLEMPKPGLLLRDTDKRPMPLPATRQVARMGGKVHAINEALTSVEARDLAGNALTAPVSRIFNGSLRRGGRFYAHGASWQNIKRGLRETMTLNGEPVVELDFATLHPAMLYAEVGAPMPSDCYSLPGWPRPLVKRAMLILLNAATLHTARLAIAYCDEMGMREETPAALAAASARAQDLIDRLKSMHRPISRFFHSDTGARLMRIESDMAEQIMLDLMSENVVALPVHDSFLVPRSKRDMLETAMMRAAYRAGLRQMRVTG